MTENIIHKMPHHLSELTKVRIIYKVEDGWSVRRITANLNK